jgi:hypothetical protein
MAVRVWLAVLALIAVACSAGSWRERFLRENRHATQAEVQATMGRPAHTMVRGNETVWTYVVSETSALSWGVDRTIESTTVYVLTFSPDRVLIRWRREAR